MLSRAARNASSWWWASHIRTKQSKWLDQNLLDMEEKVEYILNIITEDGDSFRVRAEQYYQKRPELVNFVEDTFRGYRALAERYDHLSRDLQSANRTIAMVYPERVQMSFDEEECEDFTSNVDEDENMVPTNSHVPLPPKQNLPKMGSVVQAMVKKNSKMPTKKMCKKGLVKIGVDENASRVTKSSRLSKDEALEEINKLQKDTLGFQTEKEFVKSSYENALSKYLEIEKNINEMHTKISNLQHELAVGEAIDDQDAQMFMSSFALKMSKDTLDNLKHKQKRFKTEALVEHHRVKDIKKKFEALIASNNNDLKYLEQTNEHVKDKKAKIEENELKSYAENGALVQEDHIHDTNIQKAEENDQENLVKSQTTTKSDQKESENSEEFTISEVAKKIEQLVDKVITLETDLASQIALVMRLRFEIDELHEHIQRVEQENNTLVDETNNKNIKKLEEELERIRKLDKHIKDQNVLLETNLDEASVRLDSLSNDLLVAKPDKDNEDDDPVIEAKNEKNEEITRLEGKEKEKEIQRKESDDIEGFVNKPNENDESKEGEHIIKDEDVHCNGEQDTRKWNLVFSHGIDDGEDVLVEEYTSTLKNLKEIKQKLNETENRNRARSFKSAVQMKMLRNSNDSKDAEIKSLYEKLKLYRVKCEILTENEAIKKASNMADEEEKEAQDLIPEELQTDYDSDERTEIELTNASNAIHEGTHRIRELVKTAHFELKKARELINGGTQSTKEPDETLECDQPMKSTDLVYEETQRSKELQEVDEITDLELKKPPKEVDEISDLELKKPPKEVDEITDLEQKKPPKEVDEVSDVELKKTPKEVDEITDLELKKPPKEVDELTDHELKKTPDLIDEEPRRTKERDGGEDTGHETLEIEEEVRAEIDNLKKENLEVWLRFSTSYHQINRFQNSFHDLLQEIKQAKEKKQEHGSSKSRSLYANDIRPLYRHLRDMQTEIILWLEKSSILEDDLQHRLKSLCDIENELLDLNNGVITESEITSTNVPLNKYKAATFQGEVLNMKQENIKVINELREASDRVRMLQIDIEKTLSKLDEELGQMNKSNASTRIPFKSILFGSKLRKKRKNSLFTKSVE